MVEAGTHNLADIIIVDGGSTDGSLDLAMLGQRHVRTLLTKTGPGKPGGQLRCGYSYALKEGYAGIITIDGNNKMTLRRSAIHRRNCCAWTDFVQASRFVSGGIAENTPLSRWIAIRLIHAPLCSLASGKWWTDSTQGYRGYSRRMLLDPRVQPFRDVFNTYELLAYFTSAPARLHVQRTAHCRAPLSLRGETPTKIATFAEIGD